MLSWSIKAGRERDDGSFRVADVLPGLYYLESFSTFYPATSTFSKAKPVVVGDGLREGCPIEIDLRQDTCYVTKVSGRIAAVPASGDARYTLQFLNPNPGGGSMGAVAFDIGGRYYKSGDAFSGTVCPGSYDLVLSDEQFIRTWDEGPTHTVVLDRQHVEIGATPVDGLILTPRPMASISGEVPGMTRNLLCPGGGPATSVSILREGDGQFQSVELDDKGRFGFHNVAPGIYTVSVGPVSPETLYLASILVDGKPVVGRRFTVERPQPLHMVINISGDLANAAGHLSPDAHREARWEVAWTRPKGAIAGTVLGAGGSATVKLRAARYNSNASGEYVTATAGDGTFRFDAVDPGVYTLRAEGKDFVTTEYGSPHAGSRGTPIVVQRGAKLEGLSIHPPKLSAICGKVTDSAGLPVTGKRIFTQWDHAGGVYGGPPGPSEVVTDSDGRFRVEGVRPGEYYLASPLDVNRIVFFSPDGTLNGATPVRVEAGKDSGCTVENRLELRVPANYRATYSFKGRVTGDLPPAIGDHFGVTLLDKRSAGMQNYVASTVLGADHSFTFSNVPAGQFVLELRSSYGPPPSDWSGPYPPVTHVLASQVIQVDETLKELTITPLQLPTVTGTVHFDHLPEAWKSFDISQERVLLSPRNYAAPNAQKLSSDGAFRIGPVDVGDYEAGLLLLSSPMYIKSIRLDGREVNERYLHLSAGGSPNLQLEVSDDSGVIKVRIVPDESLPMPEPSARIACSRSSWPEYQVVLFPDPLFVKSSGTGDSALASLVTPHLLTASPGIGDTKLQISSVPPGRYRALATGIPGGLWAPWRAPAPGDSIAERLWNALAALGEPVTVPAGGVSELTLPDKTVDAMRVAAELGAPLDRGLLDW